MTNRIAGIRQQPHGSICEELFRRPGDEVGDHIRHHIAVLIHIAVIKIHLAARLGRRIRAELGKQAVERVAVVGIHIGSRHLETVGKRRHPRGKPAGPGFGRIEQILRGKVAVGIIPTRPRVAADLGLVDVTEEGRRPPKPVHHRTAGVNIRKVSLERERPGVAEQILNFRQVVHIGGVSVMQQAESVIECRSLIGQRWKADIISVRCKAVEIQRRRWPKVGIEVRQKRSQVDFPSAHALVAEKAVPGGGHDPQLGVVMDRIDIQRLPRRHHQVRITGDKEVRTGVRIFGALQQANPFRVTHAEVAHDARRRRPGIRNPITIQIVEAAQRVNFRQQTAGIMKSVAVQIEIEPKLIRLA